MAGRSVSAHRTRVNSQRPRRGQTRTTPHPEQSQRQENGRGSRAGSARRSGGSSCRDDSDRTPACGARSCPLRAGPRPARTRPTGASETQADPRPVRGRRADLPASSETAVRLIISVHQGWLGDPVPGRAAGHSTRRATIAPRSAGRSSGLRTLARHAGSCPASQRDVRARPGPALTAGDESRSPDSVVDRASRENILSETGIRGSSHAARSEALCAGEVGHDRGRRRKHGQEPATLEAAARLLWWQRDSSGAAGPGGRIAVIGARWRRSNRRSWPVDTRSPAETWTGSLSWKADPTGGIVYLLGSCELARGRTKAADEAWARVVPGSAFSERAIRGRMRLFHESGQFAAAERLINDAAEDPRNDRTALLVLLVPMLSELGRIDEAERLIEDRWEHLNRSGEGALEPAIKLLRQHIELTSKADPGRGHPQRTRPAPPAGPRRRSGLAGPSEPGDPDRRPRRGRPVARCLPAAPSG